MQTLFSIISLITLSGFSKYEEALVQLLRFPEALSQLPWCEVAAWCIILILTLGPKTIFKCILYVQKSVVVKVHPTAVVSYKTKKTSLSKSQIEQKAVSLLVKLIGILFCAFVISFEASSFTDAMLIAAAMVGNLGWALILIGKTGLLYSFSYGMQAFICIVLLIRRIYWITKKVNYNKTRNRQPSSL